MDTKDWFFSLIIFAAIFTFTSFVDANHLTGKATGQGSNTTNETHLECVNLACVPLNGSGTDLCATNLDCMNTTNTTHLACVNLACVSVNGAGEDLCKTTPDCLNTTNNYTSVRAVRSNQTIEINLTHLACVNQACVVINTTGVDQCATNADCIVTNMTHLECVNQACIFVNGTGADLCATNLDCNITNLTGGGRNLEGIIATPPPVQEKPTTLYRLILSWFGL